MSDSTLAPQKTKSSNSQILSAVIAAIVASDLMNRLSLSGVDFKTLGVDSELVKSTIIGILVGFFAKLTPANFVGAIKDIILFWVQAIKTWNDARAGKGE